MRHLSEATPERTELRASGRRIGGHTTHSISHHERIASSLTWLGNAAAASAHSRV
jgi:hypothetical protein